MENISIVQANQDDAELLLEIEQATESITYSTVKNISQAKSYINSAKILWLYKNNVVIGKVSYVLSEDKTVEITGLIILPAYRKKGYGKYLVKHVIALFPNAKMKLTVHPENNSAISLYYSLGFTSQDTLTNPYGDGEPRLLMIRNPATHQK